MSNVHDFPIFRAISQFFRRSPLMIGAALLLVLCLGIGAIAFAFLPPQSPGGSTSPAALAISQARVIRMAYFKAATLLVLLKSQQVLEKRLEPLGITVEWTEFTAGPQQLEAMNAGAIDFAWVGETPLSLHRPQVYHWYTSRCFRRASPT
jgi:sulfonate transport system substrate-binding protein